MELMPERVPYPSLTLPLPLAAEPLACGSPAGATAHHALYAVSRHPHSNLHPVVSIWQGGLGNMSIINVSIISMSIISGCCRVWGQTSSGEYGLFSPIVMPC